MVHAPPARKKSNTTNGNGVAKHCESLQDCQTNQQPPAPDGGWGWMVVFGSFMIHIITDGMTYSFGLFYIEFLSYFDEGKGYTAWIVSILVGVTLASGPISSSFVNRYGCRPVTIAGAIIASVCIVVSMFAQNVLTLILTIGIGTGMGFGLIYLPAIVSVTMYFDKYRSLATGIAVCGSGFGTFVFAPLTETLIGTYGWRGAMLIIGGIVLNCIIFGAMFRPLEAIETTKKKNFIKDLKTTTAELEPLNNTNSKTATDQFMQLPQRAGDGTLGRSNSLGHSQHKIENGNRVMTNGTTANGKTAPPQRTSASIGNIKEDIIRSAISNSHIDSLPLDQLREKSTSGTMYKPDILYQGSLLNIPEYRSRSASLANNHYGSLKQSNHLSQSQDLEKMCGCGSCSKETRDTFSEMMNFSLLKDWVFIIFSVSNFCTSIGFNMPYVYIAAQGETMGLTNKQSSYLIATIGIANTVGRIILGYYADKPWVNRLLVYNACLTLCGIATTLSVFCIDFYSLALYSAVFGFTIGAYVGLTSVILVDLLGLDKLTNAFGLLLLFQGIASLVGPPIGGWMYDITNSYSPAFLMAGIMIAVSGLVLFAIPPLQRHKKRKLLHQQQTILTS